MQTALGTDFGLKNFPGLADTGLFRIDSVGPTNLTFNYADAGEGAGARPESGGHASQAASGALARSEERARIRSPSPSRSTPKPPSATSRCPLRMSRF